MKHCNLWGRQRAFAGMQRSRCKEHDAHLWLELIHAANGFIHVPSFNRIADQHTLLDGLEVDADVDPGFFGELGSGIAVAFDDQVVEHDPVQITKEEDNVSSTSFVRNEHKSEG
jgi:hypothetical protein